MSVAPFVTDATLAPGSDITTEVVLAGTVDVYWTFTGPGRLVPGYKLPISAFTQFNARLRNPAGSLRIGVFDTDSPDDPPTCRGLWVEYTDGAWFGCGAVAGATWRDPMSMASPPPEPSTWLDLSASVEFWLDQSNPSVPVWMARAYYGVTGTYGTESRAAVGEDPAFDFAKTGVSLLYGTGTCDIAALSAAPRGGLVIGLMPQASQGGAGGPASTVVVETRLGQPPAVGVGTDWARVDHSHGTPPAGSDTSYVRKTGDEMTGHLTTSGIDLKSPTDAQVRFFPRDSSGDDVAALVAYASDDTWRLWKSGVGDFLTMRADGPLSVKGKPVAISPDGGNVLEWRDNGFYVAAPRPRDAEGPACNRSGYRQAPALRTRVEFASRVRRWVMLYCGSPSWGGHFPASCPAPAA